MVWAAPALPAIALCPRVSTKLVKAAVAALLIGAVLCTAEQHPDHAQGSLLGHSQQEKSLILLRAFAAAAASSHPRPKRSTDRCPYEPITTTTITTDPFLLLTYTPEEFNLCLSSDTLMENLEALLDLPFPVEFYEVMKEKVDQAYPTGIPEEQLRRLGQLARWYSEEEISRWPVTSSDTLEVLLDPSGGKWNDSQVQQLITRYLTLGGTLTGSLLRKIGGRRLCNLQEEQMEQIPAKAMGTAGQLDISTCSQSKKELLYRKAQEAFASLAGTPSLYYCRLRPYLGGAPAEDLKYLANAGEAINMDMDTFLSLNPKELQKLSVTDVKNLLGENLWELKEAENEPLVMGWVQRQSQRELDRVLGIGLQGGMEEPTGTSTPAPPTTTASATSTAPVPVPTTLPTVPTPAATTTPPATQSSTVPHQTPTPSALSPTPPNNTAPTTGSPPATSTATSTAPPALTTTPIAPCSTHQSPTTNTSTPSPVPLLPTTLAPVNPSTTSPSSVPVPAVTSRATTSTSVGPDLGGTSHSTSSPLVPVSTPVPGGTTHPAPSPHSTVTPSTHSAASTPVPHPTSAPTATSFPHPSSAPTATRTTITLSTHSAPSTPIPNPTSAPTSIHTTAPPVPLSTSAPPAPATNPPAHKPTPPPSSTLSTQKSITSSIPEATTVPCQSSASPGFPSPSSTTTSGEATKPNPGAVPESPQPTSNGYINLQPQPEPDSGPSLCSCLSHVLAVTVGILLLQGLL